MPLVFLVPAILAGLVALVVPVMLHLRRRERERPMRFPSLMFLQRVTITTARRRRITDLPLLLLRASIIALAVLAFARPVVRPTPGARPASGTRRVVVLIDRSLSMGHLAVWPAAIDSARAIVNALAPGDRVAVVSFDEEASVEQPLTIDHAAAIATIARLQPGSRGTRFGAGIRAARDLLAREADVTGGEVLVITDLQRSGAAGLAGLTLPAAVHLRAVNASSRRHGNSAITGISVQRLVGADSARHRLAVLMQIATTGLSAPRRARVTMSVNGRVAGSRDVDLRTDGTASVAFDPVSLPVGGVRLMMAIDHDSLPADDLFNAVVPPEGVRRVLLGVPPDLAPNETLYLQRALETGDDPALRIEQRNPATLDATALRDAVAVVLYDVAAPTGRAGTALAAWVHDGGGLVAVAGVRTASRGAAAGILPGAARGLVDRTGDRGGVLGVTALEHPIFSAFRAGAGTPLGSARFFRYARVTPSADAQVLARFDDGLPALLERQEGAGRVILDVMPLDATSGDFPIQPTYLPFLRGMVLYAAGNAAVPLWRTTGDGWLVPTSAHNPVVRAPSGKLLRPDAAGAMTAVTLDEAGFYSVYEGRPSGDPLAIVAVNPPARESDLTQMAPGEMLVGVGQDSVQASVLSAATLAEAEGRQRIWRTLLLLAAVLLVVETMVASRGWRGAAASIAGPAADGSSS
jgi:von Willebrand factor type A domain/Aerotolerance regulator N-terminal